MDSKMIRAADRIDKRSVGRIPEQGLNYMDINAYIASLTDQSRCPMNRTLSVIAESLQKGVGVYTYLRDKHGAKTYGEALELLRLGKVDPGVVELWIEKRFIVNDDLRAATIGYPQYSAKIKEISDKWFEEHERQFQITLKEALSRRNFAQSQDNSFLN